MITYRLLWGLLAGLAATASATELKNAAFDVSVVASNGGIIANLAEAGSHRQLADGPYFYYATKTDDTNRTYTLEQATVWSGKDKIIIRGKLAGLDVEQVLELSADRPILDEYISVHNGTTATVRLADFEAGFMLRVADAAGNTLPEFSGDRLAAVPFLHRAIDAPGQRRDYPLPEIVKAPGFEPHLDSMQHYSEIPSRHRASEGWAWSHGREVLGVFKFCQENMLFSVVSTHRDAEGVRLRFGGAAMIGGEPADLGRIAPGATVALGLTRYQAVTGDDNAAAYALRALLDEQGCRFPKDYNPPVHWEQLYDMNGAWNDRAHRFTKAALEKEAQKGHDFSCEALYLDPGWDTDFGTFLWGEQWLGPRKEFIEEMQSKYGLQVSLHCPLASWVSSPATWGPHAIQTYPAGARRIPPGTSVPAIRDGRRNLALLRSAKANASSTYADGTNVNHTIAHLNDGWYGNSDSWIPKTMPAWAEIDLGAAYTIAEVRVSSDNTGQFKDRAPTKLRIQTATEYDADSAAKIWRTVGQYAGSGILTSRPFAFEPVPARWVRVQLPGGAARDTQPRLDEIEIYEAATLSAEAGRQYEAEAQRGLLPLVPIVGGSLCLGSTQYLATAADRLLSNCADGVVFLMFDGNWWNGGCDNAGHGHPVPYRMEDHMRANVDLAQRIHAQYPKVLIEMHDMIAGGSRVRFTPIYYKYGLPGSYDENWGFELMWHSMADIQEGRATSLYYSDLGCNVPFYLHVTLQGDNVDCLVLWWYASTCRHLGIGGTNPDPKIVAAEQAAMRQYHALERFYKRGEFYGINEEIHLHVLPAEHAFTVNVFNLSGKKKTVTGTIDLQTMGLDPSLQYVSTDGLGTVANGRYHVAVELPAWGTKIGAFGPSLP